MFVLKRLIHYLISWLHDAYLYIALLYYFRFHFKNSLILAVLYIYLTHFVIHIHILVIMCNLNVCVPVIMQKQLHISCYEWDNCLVTFIVDYLLSRAIFYEGFF